MRACAIRATAPQLHARALLRHDARQSEQQAERRGIRAQGQLLRLPEAVRRCRRGRIEAAKIFGQAASLDPYATPLAFCTIPHAELRALV